MKEMEEAEKKITRLLELASNPELIMDGCGHSHFYYGVRSVTPPPLALIEEVEAIVSPHIPGFERFCSFLSDKSLRYLCDYSYGSRSPRIRTFVGVSYLQMEELTSRIKEDLSPTPTPNH